MRTVEELMRSTDPFRVAVNGMIRRMAIDLTTKVLWRLTGFRLFDGSRETFNAEPFSGIGFYSRPPASGKPEAIAVMVGADAKTPVIVATRDEKTRAAVAGSIATDETAVFNSKTAIYIKADGSVEIRSVGGVAVPLATKADVTALAVFVNGLFVGGSGSVVIPPNTVPRPTGTTKLRGE